jgi:hypothetical protein
MNDDQMDELLIQGVRDYNAPGAVPREEMWRRIQATRLENRKAARSVSVAAGHGAKWWMQPSVGIAAAIILAIGIGIGAFVERRPPAPPTVAVVPAGPAAPTTVASQPAPVTPETANQATADTTTAGIVRQLHEATRRTDEKVRALASANPATPAARDGTPSTAAGTQTPANQSLAYRLVVLQHLAGSEAMITSFRADARSGEMDAELASWSRELLGTTRLLEASQASNDPVMKRLLEDLDLVISQIVQYTTRGTTNQEELDLIEQSINRRGVISNLRSTILSRKIPAGT